MEILKLLIENPISGVAVALSIGSFIFYCGSLYSSLRTMQETMVTKQDLELAFSCFSAKIHDTFVTKLDCDKMHKD